MLNWDGCLNGRDLGGLPGKRGGVETYLLRGGASHARLGQVRNRSLS